MTAKKNFNPKTLDETWCDEEECEYFRDDDLENYEASCVYLKIDLVHFNGFCAECLVEE